MANSTQQMWQPCHDGSRRKSRPPSLAATSASSCLAPLCKNVPIPRQLLFTPQPPENYFAGHYTGGAHRDSGVQGQLPPAALNGMFFEDWMMPFAQQGVPQGFYMPPQVADETPPTNTQGQVAHGLPATTTTLLIRHVPRKLLQEEALRVWSINEYNYDIFYLGYDLEKRRGTARIHINFVTHADAVNFYIRWNGRAWPSDDGKRLFIEPAIRQGFHANNDYWQEKLTRSAGAAFLPAVFYFGQRYPF